MSQAMDAFTIACETCGSRLKVRSRKAIGQLVNCPKCGSMVLIPAPAEGSTAPAPAETKAGQASGRAKPLPAASGTDFATPDLSAPTASHGSTPDAASADGIPLPAEKPAIPVWKVLALVGTSLALLLSAGLYWAFTAFAPSDPPIEIVENPDSPEPTPTEPTEPVEPASPDVEPTEDNPPAVVPEVQPVVRPEMPEVEPPPANPPPQVAEAQPNPPPQDKPDLGAPLPPVQNRLFGDNIFAGVPGDMAATERPKQRPILSLRKPAVEVVPEAMPAATPEKPPLDIAARLADPIPELVINDAPLNGLVDFLSRASTIPMTFDLASLTDAGVTPADVVSLRSENSTVGEVLDEALQQHGLAFFESEGRIVIASLSAREGFLREERYDVADLVQAAGVVDPNAELERLTAWVKQLAGPTSWKNDPETSLNVAGNTFVVEQHIGTHADIAELLARLRIARRLNVSPEIAARWPSETRVSRGLASLARPVTANFQDEPLRKILAYLERKGDVILLVDGVALASTGLSAESKATLSARQEEPLDTALSRLLESLNLVLRTRDARTFEITTAEANGKRFDLETYNINDLAPDAASAEQLLARLKQQVEPATWTGGEAAAIYDPVGRVYIVRQTQPVQVQIENWLAAFRTPTDVEKPADGARPAAAARP